MPLPPLLLLSRFSRVRLCATPQTAAHQAPPSLGFSRQEHWSGLPFPSPTALWGDHLFYAGIFKSWVKLRCPVTVLLILGMHIESSQPLLGSKIMQCFEDDGDVWYNKPVLEEGVDSHIREGKGLLWEEESEPQPLLLEIWGLGHLVWWVHIGAEVQHLAWLGCSFWPSGIMG